LLVDATRQFGYCEKAGSGIDKVYYQLILDEFDFPIFESDANSFKVIIRLRRDRAFAKFIQDFGGGLNLKLTDLITIKALHTGKAASMIDLAKLTQRSGAYMQDVVADLQRRRVVTQSGSGRIALADDVISQIGRYDDFGQLKLFWKIIRNSEYSSSRLAFLHQCECAEVVVFQLEQPTIAVERFIGARVAGRGFEGNSSGMTTTAPSFNAVI
jgi:hypothetical protein